MMKPETTPQILDPRGNPISMSGFRGGQTTREMLSWNPPVRSADAELLPDIKGLMGRAYDQQRNSAMISGGLQIHLDNVVGAGLRLSSKPDYKALGQDADWAAEWSRIVERKFRLYADDPDCYIDAGRRNTFGSLIVLGYLQYKTAGATLATAEWLPDRACKYSTAIQMVDAARLSNPHGMMDTARLRGGVEMDRMGAPTAYHFRSALQSDSRFAGSNTYDWKRVERETRWGRQKVIHLFEQKRPGQSVGISSMAPIIANSFKRGKLQDVSMDAAILNSMYAAILKTDMDYARAADTLGAGEVPDYTEAMLKSGNEFYGDRGVQMNGTKVLRLFPGDDFSFTTSDHPGPNFVEFERSFLRDLAAGWNMTYEQLARDYTQTNYSGARAGLMESWKHMMAQRQLSPAKLASSIFALWLEEAIDKGEIELPPGAPDFYEAKAAYCKCRWIGPPKGQIDPLKESKADELEMDMGTLTFEDACASRGLDWEEQLEQIARETKRKNELGLRRADNRGYMVPESDDSDAVDSQVNAVDDEPEDKTENENKSDPDTIKKQADAYGVSVRAGALTPQPEDEKQFRKNAGLPEMSTEVQASWKQAGNTRHPITLQDGKTVKANQDIAIDNADGNDEDKEIES